MVVMAEVVAAVMVEMVRGGGGGGSKVSQINEPAKWTAKHLKTKNEHKKNLQ